MDTKIPKQLRAYIKKVKASRKKENKIPYQKQTAKQSQIVIVNQGSLRSRSRSRSSKNQPRRDEYPRIVYQPMSMPNPSHSYINITNPLLTPFEDRRQQPINIFNQQRQDVQREFGVNQAPGVQPANYQPPIYGQTNQFNQRDPQPYNFMNANVRPLYPLPIDNYQVEQDLPSQPIPQQNPILPDIVLEPNHVIFESGPINVMGYSHNDAFDEPKTPSSPKFFDVIPPPSESVPSIAFPVIQGFVENEAVNQLNQQVINEKKAYDDFGGYDAYTPAPAPAFIPFDYENILGRSGEGAPVGVRSINDTARQHIFNLALLQNIPQEDFTADQVVAYNKAFKYIKDNSSPELLNYLENTINDMELKTRILSPKTTPSSSQKSIPSSQESIPQESTTSLKTSKSGKLSDAARRHINNIDEIELIAEERRTPQQKEDYKNAYAYIKKYPYSEVLDYLKSNVSTREYQKVINFIDESQKNKKK